MKKRQKKQPKQTSMTTSALHKMEAFTFGEPSPVLDRRDILDYVECINNGKWYEPPVNFSGLAKSLRAAVHHSSPIYVKRFCPAPLSRTRCCRVRTSAALCLIIWCLQTAISKSA